MSNVRYVFRESVTIIQKPQYGVTPTGWKTVKALVIKPATTEEPMGVQAVIVATIGNPQDPKT